MQHQRLGEHPSRGDVDEEVRWLASFGYRPVTIAMELGLSIDCVQEHLGLARHHRPRTAQ